MSTATTTTVTARWYRPPTVNVEGSPNEWTLTIDAGDGQTISVASDYETLRGLVDHIGDEMAEATSRAGR